MTMAPAQRNPVEQMIAHAVRAGAFRAAALEYPKAADSFIKAAAVNSDRAAALASIIGRDTDGGVA